MDTINYEEFSKIKLKVAEILSAERVEGSDKLLRLEISLGKSSDNNQDEKRQIIAGIGRQYSPETIIGKQIIIVTNLEPRKLMGLESHGMLLAASTAEIGPMFLTVDGQIDNGAEIH